MWQENILKPSFIGGLFCGYHGSIAAEPQFINNFTWK
jgi:hypothetical protein